MSSSETQKAGVALTVNASDSATEIFIVDGAYRLVARGVGAVTAQLPEGLYKVKLQCGSHVHERFVRLERGHEMVLGDGAPAPSVRPVPGGVSVTFPPLRFASAVPLADTGRTHDYQLSAAEQHSRKVHVRLGEGSELFLFARRWTSNGGASASSPQAVHPTVQLALHDLNDEKLVDLDERGARDSGAGDPWVACNVALNPGLYRLRMEAPEYGTLETTVMASPGWQTQVFIYRRMDRTSGLASRPNLAAASVLLRRKGEGFDARSPDLRLSELARAGLRTRRSVISPQIVEEMLVLKRDNPMLGIYACHLWLLSSSPDLPMVRKVVENLRDMLGPHPDVEALAIAAGMKASYSFRYPPMLLRSWPILVRETLKRPELIPAGSLSARVAERLFGEGPLLIWRQDGQEPLRASEQVSTPPAVKTTGVAMAFNLPATEPLSEVLHKLQQADAKRLEARLSNEGLEGALAEALLASKRAAEKAAMRQTSRRRVPPITPAALVTALGVPLASLDETARTLERNVRGGRERVTTS